MMVTNNALIFLTMKLYKKFRTIAFLILLPLSGCVFPDHSGFYNPVTLSMKVPDGPPEYKAGWYYGCKTGASLKTFANNAVFQKNSGPDFGSGVYAHDPVFQAGWGQGWSSCSIYVGNFVNFHAMKFAPLD